MIMSLAWENPKRKMMYIMENVNMSPVIIEKIIVTNGPVSLIALRIEFYLQIFTDFILPSPSKKHEVKPRTRNSKHQEGFLYYAIVLRTGDIETLLLAGKSLFGLLLMI